MNTVTPVSSLLWQATRQWLDRVAPSLPESLRQAIEALYLAVEAGHVCIRVTEYDASWEASGWVGAPGSYRPFILEVSSENEFKKIARFYLARYHRHEASVADALRQRADIVLSPAQPTQLHHDLDALFGHDPEDRQRLAALMAQFKTLTLVSGGPGTGKTTTVVKMLALLQAQALTKKETPASVLRILLAAPTGKAAQRLSESIRAAKQKLPLPAIVIESIPESAQTLHRLLGAQGDTGRFRHNAKNLLACDLLLVDEASMIDLALMQAMLSALPTSARLVLLGDRDQLASVEAGSVFGDLCAAEGMSPSLAAALQPYGVAELAAASGRLADCRVELTRSYRFAAGSGIAALAQAARAGDVPAFFSALIRNSDLEWLAHGPGYETFLQGKSGHEKLLYERPLREKSLGEKSLHEKLQQGYAHYRDAVRTGSIADAFAAFATFRVLCAHRQGHVGVEGINTLLESGYQGSWYAGRPVIVRANDYALRLFNGDIGLCLPTAEGLRIFFESTPGEYRALAPGRLPAHEPAWAMTVHQAQGSEFDEVLLTLPEAVTPVLDRPLIYTAVTRARLHFSLYAEADVLAAALACLPQRESGLTEKLERQKSDGQ
jgi:exodeoxyribonuclease V alpha subunit